MKIVPSIFFFSEKTIEGQTGYLTCPRLADKKESDRKLPWAPRPYHVHFHVPTVPCTLCSTLFMLAKCLRDETKSSIVTGHPDFGPNNSKVALELN